MVDESRLGWGRLTAPEQTHPLQDYCLCSAILHPLREEGATLFQRDLCPAKDTVPALQNPPRALLSLVQPRRVEGPERRKPQLRFVMYQLCDLKSNYLAVL